MSTAVNKLWKLFSTESYRLPNYKGTDARVSLLFLLIRTYSQPTEREHEGSGWKKDHFLRPTKEDSAVNLFLCLLLSRPSSASSRIIQYPQ